MVNLRPIRKTNRHRADVITSHPKTSLAIRLQRHIYLQAQIAFNLALYTILQRF